MAEGIANAPQGDLNLNIHEAHAFNTSDGFSLDVFVVDGWQPELVSPRVGRAAAAAHPAGAPRLGAACGARSPARRGDPAPGAAASRRRVWV